MSDNCESHSSSAGCGCGSWGCLGSIIAAVLCWVKWHSILWMIWAFICGWIYVVYFVVSYGIEQWHLAPLCATCFQFLQ